ncbi:hypothetical protein EAF04_006959 [Stromatinia cepivora]|nr:hypothetical protein EAF04_006959 [Stromatinia cepivora]
MLWVKGRSGIGKSFLVSMIIEHLEEHTPKNDTQPLVLYFFCKTGDDMTQRGNKIMLHLLAQILIRVFSNFNEEDPHSVSNGNELRSSGFAEQELISCIDIIKKARIKMLSSAAKEDSSPVEIDSLLQPMFKSLVVTLQRKFVVVLDALDECLDYDKGLLSAMIALARSSTMRVYVGDFLRRENLFAGSHNDLLKAVRRITKRADGSFRYANLILEELKSTPSTTKQRKLIASELPDGLKNYYRQAFKNSDSETREILMIALPWLVCAQSKVYIHLVAEEFDQKWEAHEDADGFVELSLSSDAKSFLSEDGKLGTTTKPRIRAENIPVSNFEPLTIAERQVIQLVKNAGRKFLQFGSANNIELDHNSVRDYIHEDEKNSDTTTLCEKCRKENNDILVFEAGGKYGKLLMIEKIMKTLNSESFQREFIWAIGVEDDTDGARPESFETSTVFRETLLISRSRQVPDEQDIGDVEEQYMEEQYMGEQYMEDPDMNSGVILNGLEHEMQPFLSDETSHIPDELEERYELNHWTGHLGAAEEAWPEEERLQEQDRWIELYNAVEKFLNPCSWAFKSWVKRTSPWRSMDPTYCIDPLHVAAYCGLVGLIKRHAKEKYSDTWTGDSLSALHLACHGAGRFRGIELLLPDEKDINRRVGKYQETPLQLAIKSKANVELVNKLIDAGADYQMPDSFGRTCLHFAVASGDTDVTKLLLGKNADVNAKDGEVQLLLHCQSDVNAEDNDSQTPIYEACLSGDVMVARILLKHSANVNCIDKSGNTALYAALGWCQTATKSNMELAELLVRYGADLSMRDNRLHDPVVRAVALNDIKILEFLLKCWKEKDPEGCFLLNRDFDSLEPLHRAAAQGRDEVVKMLLDAGNASKLCRQPGVYDSTALHLAVKNGHKEIVKTLLDASGPSMSLETDQCGATPMHWAASKGNVEIVRILLDKGDASAIFVPDKAGATPLHCAASKRYVEAVRIILGEGDGSIMSLKFDFDQRGATPMHCAAEMGDVETLKVLLDNGDPLAIHVSDNEGATPLHLAARGGNEDAVDLLFSRGADPTSEDKYNRTPLEWMFMVCMGLRLPYEIRRKDKIERTIKLHMSRILALKLPAIDIQRRQLDLIHFAVENGNVNICSAINKELVNEKDSHGWTSVLLAVQIQRRDIIDFLSQDSQTSFGHAPTKWSLTGKYSSITIGEDGLEALAKNTGREKYYFEVTVLEIFEENQSFRLGVMTRECRLYQTSPWDLDSAIDFEEKQYQYQTGDVIGCGIDFREEMIFYTKNGELLKSKCKFIDTTRRLFPCIRIGGDQIKTRVNFEQEPFAYQDWPPKEMLVDLAINGKDEREDSVLERLVEDGLEAQIIAESQVAGNIALELQVDHENEGQIMGTCQQRNKQEKMGIECQVGDGQGQPLIEPAPLHQEELEAFNKPQLDRQEDQKEVDSDVGRVDPAVDSVEAFEPPAIPQGSQRRKKFSRVLRRLRC